MSRVIAAAAAFSRARNPKTRKRSPLADMMQAKCSTFILSAEDLAVAAFQDPAAVFMQFSELSVHDYK